MASLSLGVCFLSVLLGLAMLGVQGQDQNWGQKVKCFVIHGTVVCPGCNIRAGLFCPRRPEDKPEFAPCEKPTTPTTTTTTTALPETTESSFVEARTEMEDSEIRKWHLLLNLYQILGPFFPLNRTRRAIAQPDDDGQTCQWNGDCPCPLICCRRGAGCPKRCVMGIRLPPHIYPRYK